MSFWVGVGSNSELLLEMTKVARSRKKSKSVTPKTKSILSRSPVRNQSLATDQRFRLEKSLPGALCLLCVCSVSACVQCTEMIWSARMLGRGVLIESDCIDVCSHNPKKRKWTNSISHTHTTMQFCVPNLYECRNHRSYQTGTCSISRLLRNKNGQGSRHATHRVEFLTMTIQSFRDIHHVQKQTNTFKNQQTHFDRWWHFTQNITSWDMLGRTHCPYVPRDATCATPNPTARS